MLRPSRRPRDSEAFRDAFTIIERAAGGGEPTVAGVRCYDQLIGLEGVGIGVCKSAPRWNAIKKSLSIFWQKE
jgi:hypothetical protein